MQEYINLNQRWYLSSRSSQSYNHVTLDNNSSAQLPKTLNTQKDKTGKTYTLKVKSKGISGIGESKILRRENKRMKI